MARDMTVGREGNHILIFALPIMGGLVLQQLYNTVDSVVVGQTLGSAALGAVGTCAALTIFFAFRGDGSAMELMSESMGLGVLYSGFFRACADVSEELRKLLDLPEGHKVVTCMVIGCPAVKYQRIVPRKALKAKTLHTIER